MADEQALRQFETKAGQWYRWQSLARDFALAANYLLDWYDPPRPEGSDLSWQHHGGLPIMVLYATAVENLLKAIIIAQGSTPVVNGRLAAQLKHHDLLRHAQAAKVTLVSDEKQLLKHLGDVMEAGRYPVGTGPGKSPGARWFEYPGDVERTWAMLQRLDDVLRATGKPCLPKIDYTKRYRPPGYEMAE